MNKVMLIGAVLPSFFLAYMIYRVDRFKEPIGKFLLAFLIGAFSPLVTLLFSGFFAGVFPVESNAWMLALLGAGVPEELGRFLLLLLICKFWNEVDEPFDCVVYAGALWAGFAAVENVLYAAQDLAQGGSALPIIAMRAALCSTGHTAWGVIVGAYVGMAMFSREGKVAWALQGLGIAIALHTIYDGLLFSVNGGASIVNLFLALAVDGFTLVLAVLIVRRMGRIQKFSQGEGRDLMVQVRLMRRFRPDRSEGLGHMVTGLGFLGLLQVLLFLFFASATYFSLMQVASSQWLNLPAGFVTGWLSWVTWRALSRRIELTEVADASALEAQAAVTNSVDPSA